MAKSRIGRKAALERMQNSKGQWITTSWIKKNGEHRTLTGKYMTEQPDLVLGYARLKSPKNQVRMVNLQTLYSLNCNKEQYVVRS